MVECKVFVFILIFLLSVFCVIFIKLSNVETIEERMLFNDFIENYNKTYKIGSEEYETRFKSFQKSLLQIDYLNGAQNNIADTAFYGITKFSDLSSNEFDDRYLVYEHKKNSHHRRHAKSSNLKHRSKRSVTLPRKVDWRKKQCVSAVKNQFTCGACWAFSAIETVESMVALKTGKLKILSVQEFIDCAKNGNLGCDGGDTCNLLQWIVDNDVGIQEEEDYPLVLKTEQCKLKEVGKGVHVASNYTCDYLVGEEDTLLESLAYHGPVAVAVNALTWQYYLGGVIKFHCDGSLENLNHAVQIVGYDLDATPPYYIVRNSWGEDFGQKGYLKIAIGSNVCGIASEVVSLDVL